MQQQPSPLRDRLLSNALDPIKSSIIRDSGMGWSSPPAQATTNTSPVTSPLRIAKPTRQQPTDLARRSSSSYKHVRNNNLVSKSPFKSQLHTPSTPIAFPASPRRVSGEKRPRPMSMHIQAENENERPFALKRERRQSKTFQGLIQKEPVTKSPFRHGTLPLPPSSIPIPRQSIPSRSPLPFPTQDPSSGTSPARSSLVSKRMHGPRLSNTVKRERRKTVTFDERCDVLEFDRESELGDDAVFEPDSDEERYGAREDEDEEDGDEDGDGDEEEQQDPFLQGTNPDESYESIAMSDEGLQLDPDASITGLVDEMFSSTSPTQRTSTPPLDHNPEPPNLDTENGVPYGRTHHADRVRERRQHLPPIPANLDSPSEIPSSSYPFLTATDPIPTTPPQPSHLNLDTPPLGRTTHLERIRAARLSEDGGLDMTELPGSPSPMKVAITNHTNIHEEDLIPKFNLDVEVAKVHIPNETDETPDPFSLPAEPIVPSDSILSDPAIEDPSNLSIGHSEVSLSGLDLSLEEEEQKEDEDEEKVKKPEDTTRVASPSFDTAAPSPNAGLPSPTGISSPVRFPSPALRSSPLSGIARRVGTPLVIKPRKMGSPSIHSQTASPIDGFLERQGDSSFDDNLSSPTSGSARRRISKGDMKRRLRRRKSSGSTGPGSDGALESPVGGKRRESAEMLDQEKHQDIGRDDADAVSSIMTDVSAETAMIQTAEKTFIETAEQRVLTTSTSSMTDQTTTTTTPFSPASDDSEFGLQAPELTFDFGSKFGKGLGMGGMGLGIGSTSSKASNASVAKPAGTGGPNMKLGGIDVSMDMRSALDRLMDDVASVGTGTETSTTNAVHVADNSATDDSALFEDALDSPAKESLQAMTRPSVDLNGFVGHGAIRSVSGSTIPPPPPPKDNIKSREELIIQKRREARRIEEEESLEYTRPPSRESSGSGKNRLTANSSRPSRKRSMSTSDAEHISGALKKRGAMMRGGSDGDGVLLDVPMEVQEDPLADTIERELRKLEGSHKSKYHVREPQGIIYASSDADQISHMDGAGDVNAGKAWRTVKRPSDMNEFSKQIKEYRAQERPGKAHGKVFVKVMSVKWIELPLPAQPTALTCTLNNGIHFVTTPEVQLGKDCLIDQEFELIEHSKLEFTLTLKIRRDPHIISQYKSIAPTPSVPPPVAQSSSKGGMRGFFSSSPKKPKDKSSAQAPPPQAHRELPNNLARYLKPDGTLARSFIAFKDIAPHCDSRSLETIYPLIGQKIEDGNKVSTLQVGEIFLKIFRLPPLPGFTPDQLPQSLDECHRGIRHVKWHKDTYFEGTLTQNGGDCSSWRRRQLRVIGSNLVAFNDVTKKATATIDLKKAITVEDDQEVRKTMRSPASGMTARSIDEYDGLYGVDRSFRLIFPLGQEIVFFADTNEEKTQWLKVFRALVGHIPPHPLWGELLWQRLEDIRKRNESISPSAAGPSQASPKSPMQNLSKHQSR